MNEVFLIGKIISKVEFKFIINSKKLKSISLFKLKSLDKQIINIIGYNDMADFICSNIQVNDLLFLNGYLNENYIELKYIKKL